MGRWERLPRDLLSHNNCPSLVLVCKRTLYCLPPTISLRWACWELCMYLTNNYSRSKSIRSYITCDYCHIQLFGNMWGNIFEILNSNFMYLYYTMMSLMTTTWFDCWPRFISNICFDAFVGKDTEDEIRFRGEADEENGSCEQESGGVEGNSTATALTADTEGIWASPEDEEPEEISFQWKQCLWLLALQWPSLKKKKKKKEKKPFCWQI